LFASEFLTVLELEVAEVVDSIFNSALFVPERFLADNDDDDDEDEDDEDDDDGWTAAERTFRFGSLVFAGREEEVVRLGRVVCGIAAAAAAVLLRVFRCDSHFFSTIISFSVVSAVFRSNDESLLLEPISFDKASFFKRLSASAA
jgi:hypothetical protein